MAPKEDIQQIGAIAKRILGEPCWEASLSYGDELRLEIGDRIACQQKVMAGHEVGAWGFGTRGTDWQLFSSQGIILTSSAENVQVFKEKVKIIEETTITAFETQYPDFILTIGFSNGCELKIFPDLDDDSGVSYWELFTPDNMLLTLEPGGVWTYTRSQDGEHVTFGEKVGRDCLV